MKNDPHVTEVSDDGALLKRYRNEITDLKRRLQEVSSVTHTTATEKEVLSQLLQEKEMLQREQEDRIRNLTQLLVTSSNQVPIKKMPKRRVTWGGNTFALASRPACDTDASNLSLLESFSRKRKAETLSDLCEEDDFDSHWAIPEESPEDLEMSRSVTVRNYEYRLRSPISPEWMAKTSGNESSLEMERQQKDQALTKLEAMSAQVNQLQLQLEAQESEGTLGKSQAAELEELLQAEAQQKHEAMEKVQMLELKLADLEQQNFSLSGSDEQTRREFAETIQLCETLASEKELVIAERDYLKEELQMFVEQKEILEQEKAALSQELREKKEMDEFQALENQFRKEHENELKNEISSMKKTLESSATQCLQLQHKLEEVSIELGRKGEFVEELQRMNGKDLVQEVAKLRRSLDDAEGVSRDTKKEWAHLRSQNIALQETNLTLSTDHEKMEAEVNSLRFNLENGKLRYKNMQSDLQKELNIAFEENTRLTTLLAGKVPKNLIDSLERERAVACLNKELSASRQAEEVLRAQLETLPGKVDTLTEQLLEMEQHKASLEGKVSEMQQMIKDVSEKLAHSETCRGTEEDISRELQEQVNQLSEELQCVQAEKEFLVSEQRAAVCSSAEETERLLSIVSSLTADREQLRAQLQEHIDAAKQAQESLVIELQEQKQRNADLMKACEQKDVDFEKRVLTMSEELQSVHKEKEALMSAEELYVLRSSVASVTEERDQLKMDMQENMDIMIEVQEELRMALEKNQKQKELIKQLQTTSKGQEPPVNACPQLEDLQAQLKIQVEELKSVQAERDSLLSERTADPQSSTDEKEELLNRVKTLSEDRDKQQEILEGLRQEKQQLQLQLEDTTQELHTQMRGLTEKQQMLEAERNSSTEEKEGLLDRVKTLSEARDELQAILEGLRQEKKQLQLKLEDTTEELHTQMKGLTEKLQMLEAERDLLLSERAADTQSSTEEKEKLLNRVKTLSEDRDELQEILEGLRQEKQQLQLQLEDTTEELHSQMRCFTEKLEMLEAERDTQNSTEEKEELLNRVKTLSEDRDELQEILEGLRQEKQQLQLQLEDTMEKMQCEFQQHLSNETHPQQLLQIQKLEEHLEMTKEEMNQLKCELQKQVEQATELNVSYQTTREEKKQLENDLLQKISTVSLTQELLKAVQEELLVLKNTKENMEEQSKERENSYHKQIRGLAEDMESVKSERDLLLCEMEKKYQGSVNEKELLDSVKILSEDRDELQEILKGLKQEKQQLQLQLENTTEELHTQMSGLTKKLQMLEAERDLLLSEKTTDTQSSTEEKEKLLNRVRTLSEDRDELLEILEGLRQEKQQLKLQLEDTTEELHSQMRGMTEKLQMLEAERDSLLSKRTADTQSSTEEKEKLLNRVKTLSEDRDELQKILEVLRQEKKQLQLQLEDPMEKSSGIQERLRQQEVGQKECEALKQQVQQLEEQLRLQQAKADATQQLLSEANETMSNLKEQMSSFKQSSASPKETMSSRLQASTEQLQEVFGKSQQLVGVAAYYNPEMLEYNLGDCLSLPHAFKVSVPESTIRIYEGMREARKPTIERLINFAVEVQTRVQYYRKTFEEIVRMDLEIFEERRLQDVLLCRLQAPNLSMKEQDFSTVWEQRLSELLEKRQLYIQKMSSSNEIVHSSLRLYYNEFHPELQELDVFLKQLVGLMEEPIDFGKVNELLIRERERRFALVTRCRDIPVQSILSEHSALLEELKKLEAEAVSLLQQEKNKRFTLMQALDGAPLQAELSLIRDNQKLTEQLQQAELKLQILSTQNEHLQDSQIKANNRVSSQKEATQLLQTELQDSRALVEDKENTIQSLKSKLRESETNVPPGVAELEKVKIKLIQTEAKLASTCDEHKHEIQRMNTLLSEKEASLRRLKETLRKSLPQGEDSLLQGEDLHARLTNTRGLGVKSSILLEKTKLEEETKRLHVRISELESSVSSQQEEIIKWKSRAIKLKGKGKAEVERPSSPCTPTKRGLPLTADSTHLLSSPKKFLVTPKKILDSPNKLDSPKSRFFDVGQRSELLSKTCPKQFFDNSRLGTDPDVALQKDSWPTSPKMEDVCKTQ
ncbi:centromere-associated protein E isoform X2 [Gouania willdenowi]|nr:centromere-associated protein E isoform X2 [Gouania willdenowi]